MRNARRLALVAGVGLGVLLTGLPGSMGTARAATAVAGPLSVPASGLTPVSASGTVSASGCPGGLTAGSTISPAGGQPFIVCSGRVRSFDGTPLDTDVTIPTATATAPRPLMVFFHGWGNSKADWESTTLAGSGADSYDWNNAWFASKGYVVLTFTARGFAYSCGKVAATGYSYATDPACSDTVGEASWTHLADRRWEIHDAQYLSGLLVDAGVADPQRIVASGGSYGGGQSWEMALSQDEVVASTSTDPAHPVLVPWTSPRGTPLHLVAAAPLYPWTDLADALVQNGRAADGANGGPADGAVGGTHETPMGVLKDSYVAGLYADGVDTAQYSTPGTDPTADLTSWFAALNAGEPYEANPVVATALTQVGGAFRSPFAMPVPTRAHEVPTFVIQGETDPLFPSFQAIDMINHLRAVDRDYPVWAFLGDVGHAYAFNPHDVWHQAHDAGNAWLDAIMAGHQPSTPPITVTSTICGVKSSTAPYPDQVFTGTTYGSLAGSIVHLTSAGAQTSTSAGPAQATPESKAVDPITSGGGGVGGTPGCPVFASANSDTDQASYTWTSPSGTLLGAPIVNVDVAMTGVNASVAARLWDVDPVSGNQSLLTRTVYRVTAAAPDSSRHLAFELWPQAYRFIAGHTLKLELTQDDQPTWRADNEPSSLTFTALDLALPMAGAPEPRPTTEPAASGETAEAPAETAPSAEATDHATNRTAPAAGPSRPGTATTTAAALTGAPLAPALPLVAGALLTGAALRRRHRTGRRGHR